MQTSHEIEIMVRYSETDAMGILHHSNYFVYFEMGRTELMRSNGYSYRDMEAQGWFMVVAKLGCKYLSPARYDDKLTLRTTLTKVTAAKVLHEYKLFRDHELLAEAESTLACVDREGKLQRVPEAFQLED